MASGIPKEYYKYGLLAGLGIGALLEYENLDIAYHTVGREVRAVFGYAKILSLYAKIKRQNLTVPYFFYETVKKYGDKPMIIFAETDEVWTFNDINRQSNQLANYFLSIGYQKGDAIAIFMENHPKFMVVILALAKIGAVASLINNHLTQEGLQYCIEISKCRACIYDYSLEKNISEIAANLKTPEAHQSPFQYFCVNNVMQNQNIIGGAINIEEAYQALSPNAVPRQIRKSIKFSDEFCYIFTSGTTGLPKAAKGDHARYTLGSMISIGLAGIKTDDVIYNTGLPLYHSSGQWFGMGSSVHGGSTVILRKNFTASKFWIDCVKYNATVAQYIGETNRFLLARPPCPEEKQHKVRMVCGVGMRPQIWKEFVNRFNVPHVAEMYGSTEGTVGMINTEDQIGAVGFVFQWIPIVPYRLIKLDQNGEPVRDKKTGMCIFCKPGEEGEIIGTIRSDDRGGPENFEAYVNNKEGTKKKLIRDVIKKGDVGFRSGDIMTIDKYGWLYFRDRTGDTFRWRGENVSTTEVETVVANLCNNSNCVCYGVEIPGTEGKAGMVAILDPEHSVDLELLAKQIRKKLPKYARPLFIRIIKDLPLTGTYKLMKKDLQEQGYDLNLFQDPVYFMGPKDQTYKLLTVDIMNQIQSNLMSAKL